MEETPQGCVQLEKGLGAPLVFIGGFGWELVVAGMGVQDRFRLGCHGQHQPHPALLLLCGVHQFLESFEERAAEIANLGTLAFEGRECLGTLVVHALAQVREAMARLVGLQMVDRVLGAFFA